MGDRYRRIVLSGVLCILGALPVAAREVVLSNGQTLEVEGHRFEGDAIVFTFAGGGTLALLAEHVESIAGESLVPAAEPQPAEAPVVAPATAVTPPSARGEKSEAGSLDRLIDDLAARYDVDPLLVEAVIQVESMWNPDAVSPKGAMGLMQLMPATARGHGVTDPFDPAQNVEAGVAELSVQLRKHSGEISMALAAYNAGGRAVKRYKGIPPYRETMNYIERVLDLYFTWSEQEHNVGSP